MRRTRIAQWAWATLARATLLLMGLLLGGAGVFAAELVDRPEEAQVVRGREVITVDNRSATFDVGEPRHDGKPGGHSLWIVFIPNQSGIASILTQGSTFDPVLAVYTLEPEGEGLGFFSRLKLRASNDDTPPNPNGQGRLEAAAQWVANRGQAYYIALDGYAGRTGTSRLSLAFREMSILDLLPWEKASDRALRLGDPLSLDSRSSALPASFVLQWYFNNVPIPGATNSQFKIAELGVENVGLYHYLISDANGGVISSNPIEIQVNEEGEVGVLARDKMLDFAELSVLLGGPPGPAPRSSPRTIDRTAILHDGLSRGYKGTQIFNTTFGQRDPEEPEHCGVQGGSSFWYQYQPPESGDLTVDSIGSNFDTVVAVYRYEPPLKGYGDLVAMGCDNDSVVGTGLSRLTVSVQKGSSYLIVVDGVNGATGRAFLNYALKTVVDGPLAILQQPKPQSVRPGETLRLSVIAGGDGPFKYQWLKNGEVIRGATEAFYTKKLMRPMDVGRYSVDVTIGDGANGAGTVRSSEALVSLIAPVNIRSDRVQGLLKLSSPAKAGMSFSLERSKALGGSGWLAVTNGVSEGDEIVVASPLGEDGTFFFRFLLW